MNVCNYKYQDQVYTDVGTSCRDLLVKISNLFLGQSFRA